jgi:acetyl esterase/lipase
MKPNNEIVYKQVRKRSLMMDIYQSSAPVDAPVILYVHGGAWIAGDKRTELLQMGMPIAEIAAGGYTFASVEYHLVDDAVKYPAPVEDVKDAVRFIWKNARELGIDPQRIALLGVSAGAHLAMLAALTPSSAFIGDADLANCPSTVRTVVSWSGPTDFTLFEQLTPSAKRLVSRFIGKTHIDRPDLYRQASPAAYLAADSVPMMLIHGDCDSVVPYAQAKHLCKQARELGVDVEFITIANADHMLQPIGEGPVVPDIDTLLNMILRYIDKRLAP